MIEITDEMCRRAIKAMEPDRIQGFSTPQDATRRVWGAPHYVRDEFLQRELWRGDSDDEMMERCQIEEMRLALQAAFEQTEHQKPKPYSNGCLAKEELGATCQAPNCDC